MAGWSPAGSTATLVLLEEITGCRIGRSLLDFMSKNTDLLPREGALGLVDLPDFMSLLETLGKG